MAILTKGQTFANADTVTSTKLNALVDSAAFVTGSSGTTDDSTLEVNGSGRLQIKDLGVTSAKIAASGVTTAKIASATGASDGVTYTKLQHVANMRVIGNVSGSLAAPTEVSILDEDTMSSDSATAIPTQQSVKAYVTSSISTAVGSTYAGGQSSTLPNGMIIKVGTTTVSANTTSTVSFSVAFPTACVNIQATFASTSDISEYASALIVSASQFSLRNSDGSSRDIYWMAIGY